MREYKEIEAVKMEDDETGDEILVPTFHRTRIVRAVLSTS